MASLREVLERINQAVAKDPSLLDLECFATDNQCAHIELSGHTFRESLDFWPSEYCIEDSLPHGATAFVRIC